MARPLRVLILAVAYLAAVAVVVGVIAVRFHYFSDTVAGAAVGTGTACGLALVLDVVQPRSVGARWMAPVAKRAR